MGPFKIYPFVYKKKTTQLPNDMYGIRYLLHFTPGALQKSKYGRHPKLLEQKLFKQKKTSNLVLFSFSARTPNNGLKLMQKHILVQ